MDNKTFIDNLTRRSGVARKDCANVITALQTVLSKRCADMDSVAIPGFGCFETKKKLERIMLMPSTGKRILVPPKLLVTFKPSALLKQRLKKNYESISGEE
jgi:nucleoid DNA-binding protein